ncbi:hypothetical protein AV274_4414 [Blastocystis sp. ATCC 50177/Nand II]|uniref:Asteroid domain-containing protein n=1 Tax=Blastocystis sp. subtype 1 (strain ATCC 50177 / NandII) TaxID=478820 RepID=A0A196SA35_BLAHN|nr:hypothetical protein AV274_4414 [Blastocystis sp. ATCC 50177/Nand II]
MGVRGLKTFLQRYSEQDTCSQTQSSELVLVVVDGSNLESNIVSNAAKVSLASCCSYEYLYKYTFDFLNWMESTNIQIEQYYDDMMSDMDKVKTDLDRKKKRIDRSIELISTLNEDYEHGSPEGLVDGVGYPRMCIQCVRSAVDAFLRKRGKSRLFACSDPDREIAKYAEMHKCYVLTGDYDFAVFPVNGIVDVLEVFKAFDHKSHSIPTIPRDTMLNALHLTNLKLLYTAVLCGNDFGSRGKPACLEDMPKDVKAIDVVMNHIIPLADTKETLIEDCMTQFPNLSRAAIEKWFSFVEFKYNTKAYPSFPQSCLKQSIIKGVFTLCGISKDALRQLLFRYGTSYSSFLFDYIFLPRISIPVTLFFQNDKVNDFLLDLNITLYNMIGHDVEDPYVVVKDDGHYEPSKEAVEDRRNNPFPVLRRRLARCLEFQKLEEEKKLDEKKLDEKKLDEKKKLELLASFHSSFSFEEIEDGMFSVCCFRLTSEELGYLFDEAKVNTLMDRLINMVNMRIPSAIHVPPNDLGCALECFSLACGLVYAVFQFLQLQTDDSLLKRSSLKVLLRLNAEEEDADSTNSEESD